VQSGIHQQRLCKMVRGNTNTVKHATVSLQGSRAFAAACSCCGSWTMAVQWAWLACLMHCCAPSCSTRWTCWGSNSPRWVQGHCCCRSTAAVHAT
jgi:hypothetical protein